MKKFLQVSSSTLPIAKRQKLDEVVPFQINHDISSSSDGEDVWNPFCLISADDQAVARNSSSDIWQSHKNIRYKFANRPLSDIDTSNPCYGIVGLDMDGTLIVTKSGKTFATDSAYTTDWKLIDDTVVSKLQSFHRSGCFVAIISNQNGLEKNHVTLAQLHEKVDAVLKTLSGGEDSANPTPIDFICATSSVDIFRKPLTGMWEFLSAHYDQLMRDACSKSNTSEVPHLRRSSCLYIGDAAGREKIQNLQTKDFSDSDLKLALNLRIPFATETCLLSHVNKSQPPIPNPPKEGVLLASAGAAQCYDAALFKSPATDSSSSQQELVVLVAPAACGKSTLSGLFVANGYARINQDTLGSFDNCKKEAIKCLSKGLNVCIDNTNLDVAVRAKWLEVARARGNVRTRCFYLTTPKTVAFSLAAFRLLDPSTAVEDRRKIDKILLHSHFKKLVPPTVSEGFDEVTLVDWAPQPPSHPVAAQLFNMYLL
eukprot:CAMPEP_0170063042 /NCGR_PEP_ID=MMETSP0019_2-20121128/4059_1 /TAXON_ID=98059 /ORGANISM="Dinobryon sp., Strain UTEXLB2267" /LENGTH=482 /DNA_ID=CAMNT_0010269375 /DNA_START=56 /DNA_END=1504 /DNA_ORIENTATION=-